MAEFKIEDVTETVTGVARDAFYVAVGAGVLGFQKLQVQRVQLTKALGEQLEGAKANATAGVETAKATAATTLEGAKDQAESLTSLVENRIKELEDRLGSLEHRLESVLNDLERKLPEQAKDLVKQARELVGLAA